MSLGFEQAGFDISLGIDISKPALKTFEKNHSNSNTVCGSLSEIHPSVIEKEYLAKKRCQVIPAVMRLTQRLIDDFLALL